VVKISASPINIVFASDKGYVEHLAVAMCSLFENNCGVILDVYVLNSDIDDANWRELEKIANRYGQNLIDIKISDQDLGGLVTPYHLTKQTYYRLFIPERIQGSKALYLDADIVVNGSIAELYSTDISGYYLGAVLCPALEWHKDLELSEGSKYFNAGVMLIDLSMWRRDHLKERVFDVVRMKPWAIQFADQCGLNSVVNGRWKQLPPKFNLQGVFFEFETEAYSSFFSKEELEAAFNQPVIVHYSGSDKPWHFHYIHPYRSLYWKYLRKTPFDHLFSRDITMKKIAGRCIPESVKRILRDLFL